MHLSLYLNTPLLGKSISVVPVLDAISCFLVIMACWLDHSLLQNTFRLIIIALLYLRAIFNLYVTWGLNAKGLYVWDNYGKLEVVKTRFTAMWKRQSEDRDHGGLCSHETHHDW